MITRIYLDTCCLNRPFDDQAQERIRRETEAILNIMEGVWHGRLEWVASTVLLFEIERAPGTERRNRLRFLVRKASELARPTPETAARSADLESLGFKALDALHLACAEEKHVDVFLTTDDRLLKTAARTASSLWVVVAKPLQWWEDVGQ